MRYLCLAICGFSMVITAFSHAEQAEQAEYDDCLLKHLKGAKLDIATHLIKQACYENYKKPTFTSDKSRAYNNCLLEHLVGVESMQAVMDIRTACDRKYK